MAFVVSGGGGGGPHEAAEALRDQLRPCDARPPRPCMTTSFGIFLVVSVECHVLDELILRVPPPEEDLTLVLVQSFFPSCFIFLS